MRIEISSLFVCFYFVLVPPIHAQDSTILPTDDPAAITVNNETSNNTSACYAAGNPSYCTIALPNEQTSSANQAAGAETTVVDSFPEHVSTINVKRLMYSGWNGQLICEYQPWFSENPSPPAPYKPYNGHIQVGYDETTTSSNGPATVKNQNTKMISRGCNINLLDFYGNTDTTQGMNLTGANNVYSDLKTRTNYPLKFGILEDKGAFKTACSGLTESQTISCIESHLESDLTYIYSNYASVNPGLYWQDQSTNVVGYFGSCGDFSTLSCPGDWDTIWTAVQNYSNANGYNMKFIFQFGNFDIPTISAGEYAWPQPYGTPTCQSAKDCFTSNPQSQFWWCSPTGTLCSGYLDYFYQQGAANPGHLTIGLLYKGFDDSNASWGQDRVIAEQCGQVFLDTANEVTIGGYWGTNNQIPYMQIATWNDYEEGSEVESGIDNCYTAVNTSLSTNQLNWNYTVNDSNYAVTKTIHHFALWMALSGQTNFLLKAQIGRTATSYNLLNVTGLTSGQKYDIYLELVGQPSMQNEMSNKVTWTKP